MDRYVTRRPRLCGAAPPEPSSSSGRAESPVFEIHDENSQSQTQTQCSQAAAFQTQSQMQHTGLLGDMSQTQTQKLSLTRCQSECREQTADRDTQDQARAHSDEMSGGVAADAEPAPESQRSRRQKRARPSHTHGHGPQVRTLQAHWTQTYPWLEYHQSSGAAFCHICKSAFQQNCVTCSSHFQMTFMETGFTNWRKALERFRTHERQATFASKT